MKKHAKILALALACALLLSVGAVYGAARTKVMEVTYSDIKLVIDGVPVVPKDANGTVVEPFIYEGTTYLPVRAVSEALGKTVGWDGETKTVYIGEVPGKDIYLPDVCPPYSSHHYSAPELGIKMMGTQYAHGFQLGNVYDESYAYFNLNGEYKTLEFDFGHIDYDVDSAVVTYAFYLDGELAATLNGTQDMIVQHVSIPLNGALQLKIVVAYGVTYWGNVDYYGFGNAILTK